MKLVVINPNTTTAMTDLIERGARAAAGPGADIIAITENSSCGTA